jgi:hypothetical protein
MPQPVVNLLAQPRNSPIPTTADIPADCHQYKNYSIAAHSDFVSLGRIFLTLCSHHRFPHTEQPASIFSFNEIK